MCLAIPVRVKEIRGSMAEVELGGVITEVSVLFTPEAEVGDYVVMHAGYAISVLDAEQAEETLQLFREIAEHDAAE
jgi:hydrogenase expression/formation protein HypC